jgi:methyl-accepting chemotaxis protein
MAGNMTFGRRIAAGFAVVVAFTVVVDVVSVATLHGVVTSKNRVINVNSARLEEAQAMNAALSDKSSSTRGFLLTGQQKYLDQVTSDRKSFANTLANLQRGIDGADRQTLATVASDEVTHQKAIEKIIAEKQNGASTATVGEDFSTQVDPIRTKLRNDIKTFVTNESKILATARQASNSDASRGSTLIELLAVAATLLAAALAFFLTRALRRQIGTAVAEVNSSSAELQATAMSEITTTISELLATSRQIAESAQRVAQIADQTADAGRTGVDTIGKAQTSIVDIRKQVDVIVDHMLALGEKSQQIGAVLDIVTELAEQTNILAINSTIEAAGAGEAGKRFAVVADEIRKLADRVADSTKEIRGLIDVVRGAVNTTVMATEIGSKAVDAGSEQFADVSDAFGEIAGLVTTTTEAAREIELSTKQQATAVEQVNVAIANVAQSTKEAEASSSQTFQTASQLSTLSKDLARLVEQAAA